MSAQRRPFTRRRKSCPFSGANAPKIDYKDVRLLQRFVSERGKIVPSRISAVSSKKQRELAQAAAAAGGRLGRSQIELDRPIKALGAHKITVHRHPEVSVEITALVARSSDEAEFLAKGGVLVAETERAALESAEAARRASE